MRSGAYPIFFYIMDMLRTFFEETDEDTWEETYERILQLMPKDPKLPGILLELKAEKPTYFSQIGDRKWVL